MVSFPKVKKNWKFGRQASFSADALQIQIWCRTLNAQKSVNRLLSGKYHENKVGEWSKQKEALFASVSYTVNVSLVMESGISAADLAQF